MVQVISEQRLVVLDDFQGKAYILQDLLENGDICVVYPRYIEKCKEKISNSSWYSKHPEISPPHIFFFNILVYMFLDCFFLGQNIEVSIPKFYISPTESLVFSFEDPERRNSFPRRHNKILPIAMIDLHYQALQDSDAVQSLPLTEDKGDREGTNFF